MPFPVFINGRTYSLADFAPYAYTVSFPNIVQDIAEVGAAASAVMAGVSYGNSFRNRLRNAILTINQRGVSGTVTLAAGAYGHDGFKAGSGGCTYVFGRATGLTAFSITAGSLQQIIEGALYLAEGGTYTLSWGGTAQARINGSAYAASPITVTGLTPDANATVEWGTGSLFLPMFEPGAKRTAFEYRDDELRRCQRYYRNVGFVDGLFSSSTVWVGTFNIFPEMRLTPTLLLRNGNNALNDYTNGVLRNATGLVQGIFSPAGGTLLLNTSAANSGARANLTNPDVVTLSAEL